MRPLAAGIVRALTLWLTLALNPAAAE